MTKGLKITLGIGLPVLALGVTYFILRDQAKKKKCVNSKFAATIFGVPRCSDVPIQKDAGKSEAEKAVKEYAELGKYTSKDDYRYSDAYRQRLDALNEKIKKEGWKKLQIEERNKKTVYQILKNNVVMASTT